MNLNAFFLLNVIFDDGKIARIGGYSGNLPLLMWTTNHDVSEAKKSPLWGESYLVMQTNLN